MPSSFDPLRLLLGAMLAAACGVAVATDLHWAAFVPPAHSDTGAAVDTLAVSERPGDAQVSKVAVVDGLLQVTGRIGNANGSGWSTLGMDVAADAAARPVDVSAARRLRIRLAAATPQVLRVRLKGPDRRIAAAGCYPVMMQRVTAEPTDYAIPLEAFSAEAWCGELAATLPPTLAALSRVEVTANTVLDTPQVLSVGRIDFDDAPPTPRASAAAEAPRKPAAKPAAKPQPAPAVKPAPARQVVCERNHLGLMMCY
jgi:hypothetical protein